MEPDADHLPQVALTRSELLALVRILQTGGALTESDATAILILVERAVPHPEVSDLIFHRFPSLSAEEIVDQALSYRAIEL